LSLALAAVLVVISLLVDNKAVTNGLTIGALVGIFFFVVAWWAFSIIVRDWKQKRAKPILSFLAGSLFLLKFVIIGVALWYAFKYYTISPLALVAGIAVTQISILLAGVSKLFNR